MRLENRTRITIETERTLILAGKHSVRGWCHKCGTEVEFLPSLQAVHLLEGSKDLRRRVTAEVHLNRAKDELLICLKSLFRFLQAASGQSGS